MSSNATTSNTPPYRMPLVRVDLVLLAVQQGCLHVIVSKRQETPFKGQWGLPGGVLRIDLDMSLEAAAQRVAQERLGRKLSNLDQVVTVGGPDRDPRAPWAMTVVYGSLVSADLETTPGKRVQALNWRPVSEIGAGEPLAFDHAKLIRMAVQQLRQAVRDLRFPAGATPDEFTLPELQALSESILGEKIDKVTFRRRVEATQLVEPVTGSMRGGAHRPAQVYRLR
ncbi:NUDIX domain-containing protein [Limnohabitans sp.]|uniref:NUDIX hydrolase n=1 Tax=Limnohabitans sp. TaxID=1907725 RepID=UPI0035B00FD1